MSHVVNFHVITPARTIFRLPLFYANAATNHVIQELQIFVEAGASLRKAGPSFDEVAASSD
jgi:hypothetical protein